MFFLLLAIASSASLNSLLDENEEVKQFYWLNTKLNSKCSFNLIVFTNSLKLAIDASRSMMVEIAFFSPREVKLSLRKIITMIIITTTNMMNMITTIMRRGTMRRTILRKILRRKKKMIKRRKILKS